MDLEPRLNRAVLEVRDALLKFAASKGWSPDDYRIFMTVNVVWGNIIVDFVAKAFDSAWSKDNPVYDEILDHLERELSIDPGLYESVSLLINPFTGYWFGEDKQDAVDNYMDIDERLLNPDVEVIRPVAPVSQGETI